MREYGFIYKILNILTGKIYIGQTTQKPNRRWAQHLASSRLSDNKWKGHIHRAIAADGAENFAFKVIGTCSDQAELDQIEAQFITLYQATTDSVGYNKMSRSRQQGAHAESTKQAISKANSGKVRSTETKEKLRGRPAWNKGRQCTPEEIERNRQAQLAREDKTPPNKGKKTGKPAWNRGLPSPRKGMQLPPRTAEHSAKISASKKGRCPWNKGLKGAQVAWNKALTMPKRDEVLEPCA